MLTQALQDERHARQRRDTEIGDLRRRKDAEINDLRRRKDAEINDLRRTAHRWTARYNNDTEHWRVRHGCVVRQAQNWHRRYRDESRQHQKQRDITQRLEGAIINNDARKKARINTLIHEKFALQLINRNSRQIILALQNNPPNIQQIGMVGYRPPIFYGHPGEDPEDWLRDMQRYIIANRINVAPGAPQAARREEVFELVVSCLTGNALNWYLTRVRGKNWRCNNLSDNLGVANLNAVRALATGNGGNQI